MTILIISNIGCFNSTPKPSGNIGFMNLKEQVIIEPQLEKAGKFNNGLVLGKSGDYYYVYNTEGEIVSSFYLELDFSSLNLENGKFWAIKKNAETRTWCQIDINGKIVFEKQCNFVWRLNEGRRPFKISSKDKEDNYGYLDENNNVAIEPKFETGSPFSEGLACVKKNGKYGYIDHSGMTIIPFIFDDASSFNDEYTITLKDSKVNIINKEGKTTGIVDTDYMYLSRFSEGAVALDIGNRKYQFFDANAELLFNKSYYTKPGDFENGKSIIAKSDKRYFINKKGETISPTFSLLYQLGNGLYLAGESTAVGLIDTTFTYVIPPKYKVLYHPSEGMIGFER